MAAHTDVTMVAHRHAHAHAHTDVAATTGPQQAAKAEKHNHDGPCDFLAFSLQRLSSLTQTTGAAQQWRRWGLQQRPEGRS